MLTEPIKFRLRSKKPSADKENGACFTCNANSLIRSFSG